MQAGFIAGLARMIFARREESNSCSQLFAFYEEPKSWVTPPYVVPADVEKFSFAFKVFEGELKFGFSSAVGNEA